MPLPMTITNDAAYDSAHDYTHDSGRSVLGFVGGMRSTMLWAVQHCLSCGPHPPEWVVSLQTNIPKTPMADMLADMRPIALQNVTFKWLATCVLLQVQDALQIVVPAAQKGFMKGRRMLDHIERARLLWDSSDAVNMLPVDFSKVYNSILHAFFAVALRFFAVPEAYVQLLVSALRGAGGAVFFCIDAGYVQCISMVPGSGIHQGDFSPCRRFFPC